MACRVTYFLKKKVFHFIKLQLFTEVLIKKFNYFCLKFTKHTTFLNSKFLQICISQEAKHLKRFKNIV